jgi:predicted ATPase
MPVPLLVGTLMTAVSQRLEQIPKIFIYLGSLDVSAYSQVHSAAGEASVITVVSWVKSAAEGAPILIEQIENGLHPVAVRQLFDHPGDAALRRKLQMVFTTHSQNAVCRLPHEAV